MAASSLSLRHLVAEGLLSRLPGVRVQREAKAMVAAATSTQR